MNPNHSYRNYGSFSNSNVAAADFTSSSEEKVSAEEKTQGKFQGCDIELTESTPLLETQKSVAGADGPLDSSKSQTTKKNKSVSKLKLFVGAGLRKGIKSH